MIDNIRVLNLTTGVELAMGKTRGFAYLLETDGINWNDVKATHNSFVNLTGVGNTITSSKLESRTVSITGRVSSIFTNKEIAQRYDISGAAEIAAKKLEEIEEYKKYLSQTINPLHFIQIISNDYYIQGKPQSSVTFSPSWKENNEIYCKFTFSVECNDPLFHSKTSEATQLSGTFGGFHFPVVIPSPNGMHFGIRRSYQLVNVTNDGDTALGGIIFLKATGTVNNPTLTNVWTQEFIKIHKTLQEGEVIEIDTVNRKIVGATDGTNFTNYFAYWDFDNTWFQFDIGDTLFGFSTPDSSYKSLNLWIEINKSYYSMEEQ